MSKVLVIHHSDTGNTEALARLVAEGAGGVEGVEVELVRAGEVDVASAGGTRPPWASPTIPPAAPRRSWAISAIRPSTTAATSGGASWS